MLEDRHNQAIEDRIFSRKKSLLTVQQYANSQGVSTGVVDECAKLGVVQVRKHKDKTFIVDLPLDATKNARQQEDTKVEQINATEQAQRISDMVSKIFQPGRQTTKLNVVSKPVVPPIPNTTKQEAARPQVAIPDLKLFAQEEKQAPAVKFEKFEPVTEFKVSSARKISDAFKITAANRFLLGILSAGIIVCLGAYYWTSYQNQIQQKKLQSAYASITKLMNDYDSATRKARLYELDSSNWRAEAQRSQKSIASLEVELVRTKERLSQTQDDLSTVQQNHVDTLKKLNEQIQAITSKIKSTKKTN